MYADITDIKRFAVHDGQGIRTTVFFKGCSLKCVWCHNPETIRKTPQTAFYENKCTNCGVCMTLCQYHTQSGGAHLFDRQNCTACGECVGSCPSDAFKVYGKRVDTEDIVAALLQDRAFYENSNGGITLSGGECLLQPNACSAILKHMKAEGINTAVDTCGNVPWDNIDSVLEYTDTFLYDIKAADEKTHILCTGSSNRTVLENLNRIDNAGRNIEIRIPYVPGYNDNELEGIVKILSELKHIIRVKVLPYHNYAGSKYMALGMENTLPSRLPSQAELEKAQRMFMRWNEND